MAAVVAREEPGIGHGKPGPGRPKGCSNRVTVKLREMILATLDQAGGEAYLAEQAKRHPKEFVRLIERALPRRAPAGDCEGSAHAD